MSTNFKSLNNIESIYKYIYEWTYLHVWYLYKMKCQKIEDRYLIMFNSYSLLTHPLWKWCDLILVSKFLLAVPLTMGLCSYIYWNNGGYTTGSIISYSHCMGISVQVASRTIHNEIVFDMYDCREFSEFLTWSMGFKSSECRAKMEDHLKVSWLFLKPVVCKLHTIRLGWK